MIRERLAVKTERDSQKGFTLIELSIVLVIIGLLIGGVIKGQDLINSTKTTKLMQEAEAYQNALMAYEERYNAKADNDEADRFGVDVDGKPWHALRLAGLIPNASGQVDANDDAPEHSFGGEVSIENAADAMKTGTAGSPVTWRDSGTAICFVDVPASAAAAMDSKYDDGIAVSGSVRGSSTNNTAGATADYGTSDQTAVCILAQ
jgi:prepilin-type N-terminal cleavage/methylation domain-containing protein